MSSLLDVARVRAASKKRGGTCTIATIRAQYPDKAKEIDELVANSGPATEIPYSVAAEIICEALKLQRKFKGEIISRHKRGECRCPS